MSDVACVADCEEGCGKLMTGDTSFFGTQEGEFSLVVKSISAMKESEQRGSGPSLSKEAVSDLRSGNDGKETATGQRRVDDEQQNTGVFSCLATMCTVS